MPSPLRIGPRGVPEVPLLPELHPQVRRFLEDLRQQVINLSPSRRPLKAPTNLAVTPEDRSNLIYFTRVPDADYYEILWSPTSSLKGAQILNITTSNQYHDWIGSVGTIRFYWVRARYFTSQQIMSTEAGPVSGTTLAVGSVVGFPNLPPPGPQYGDVRKGRNYY